MREHQVMFNAEMDLQDTDKVYDDGDQPDGGNPDEPSDDEPASFKIVPSNNTRLAMYCAHVTDEAKEEVHAVANGTSLRTLSNKFGPLATQLRYVEFPYFNSYIYEQGRVETEKKRWESLGNHSHLCIRLYLYSGARLIPWDFPRIQGRFCG